MFIQNGNRPQRSSGSWSNQPSNVNRQNNRERSQRQRGTQNYINITEAEMPAALQFTI